MLFVNNCHTYSQFRHLRCTVVYSFSSREVRQAVPQVLILLQGGLMKMNKVVPDLCYRLYKSCHYRL